MDYDMENSMDAKVTPEKGTELVERLAMAASPTPLQILDRAVARGASVDELQRLMDLHERWQAADARRAFNEAFSSFKSEAVQIIKNQDVKDGPLKGKKYADLFAVVNAVTPALSRHGLSASWKLTKDDKDWLEVTCTIRHVLGHSESVSMGGPPDAGGAKNAIQARASSKSYLERYTLLAATGLAASDTDTDGNGGGGKPEPDAAGKKALEECGSIAALQAAWKALTPEQRKTLGAVKDDCKARIEAADKQ